MSHLIWLVKIALTCEKNLKVLLKQSRKKLITSKNDLDWGDIEKHNKTTPTMATGTGTSLNERFYDDNNGCVLVL